jgi:16S rRNA (adenine1518-N6/adenine1519-N6)-dimethyltransferase
MAKRHLGQVFLYDPSILRRIIQIAQLSEDDLVVEIGPGRGSLTRMLAESAKNVIAIELDERLFEELKVRLAGCDNVLLIHEDALKYPYENLPDFKVVANIPYYITTPIIFRLLQMKHTPDLLDAQKIFEIIPSHPVRRKGEGEGYQAKKNLKSMTLTIQKEVAERIVASPGGKDYGVLSVMIQYYTDPELKFIIPRGVFRPIPKINSAVVHFKILEKPPVSVKNEEFFFRVVKMAFSQRRKMLSNALKSLGEDIKAQLAEAGIDPRRRPETLSIEEFARLSDMLKGN